MTKPPTYDKSQVDEVVARLTSDRQSHGMSKRPLQRWNVVVVLSESFADPLALGTFELERDPLRQFRTRADEGIGTNIFVDGYGTGTSNMEFQVLTGMSLGHFEPEVKSAYLALAAEQGSFASSIGWLKKFGYQGVAIHPFSPEVYQREEVYARLGIDQFKSRTTMRYLDPIDGGRFISDESVFREAMGELESSSSPVILNIVTMQNHLPVAGYSSGPIKTTGELKGKTRNKIGMWSKGLEHSSDALDGFLDQLEELDEPTAVVYYGDHYPGIFDRDMLKAVDPVQQKATPALIWANRPIQDANGLTDLSSSTTLLPRLFQALGIEIPPYYQFLLDFEEMVGTVTPDGIMTNEGKPVNEINLTKSRKQMIEDYRLLQYDFTLGNKWALDELWYDWDPMVKAQDTSD